MRRALVLVTALLSTSALAQSSFSSVAGVIVDVATQKPISDVQVTARSAALVGEQSAVTDAAGTFEMTFLPAGAYVFSVKRDGYQPFTADPITLKGRRTHVRVALAAVPPSVDVLALETAVEFNEATMIAPAMISGPAPEYTPEAIERNVEGNMQIRCVVTVDGQVRACKVLKGLPFMNAAVVDALQKRKYKPATAQGKPIDVYFTFNVRLKLPAP
jgi:protein TonB